LLDSDPVARKLVSEHKNVRMPDLGLSGEQVQTLVELLTTCSTETCDLKGKFTPVTKATPDDVARGVSIFLGKTPLANGGPACISCHTVEGVGSVVQGGSVGVDLTHAFARLGDESLDAALKNPSFALMNKVYGDKPLAAEEAFALRAALYDANRGALTGDTRQINVVLIAALAALLALVGLNAVWPRRKHANVREALVHKEQQS
jgi:mono/diheme cytochrome c family protein